MPPCHGPAMVDRGTRVRNLGRMRRSRVGSVGEALQRSTSTSGHAVVSTSRFPHCHSSSGSGLPSAPMVFYEMSTTDCYTFNT